MQQTFSVPCCSSSWLRSNKVSTAGAPALLFKTWEVWQSCDLSPVCNSTPLPWIRLCSNKPEKLVKSVSWDVPEDLVLHWRYQTFVYCFHTKFCTWAVTRSPCAVEMNGALLWWKSKPLLHPACFPHLCYHAVGHGELCDFVFFFFFFVMAEPASLQALKATVIFWV